MTTAFDFGLLRYPRTVSRSKEIKAVQPYPIFRCPFCSGDSLAAGVSGQWWCLRCEKVAYVPDGLYIRQVGDSCTQIELPETGGYGTFDQAPMVTRDEAVRCVCGSLMDRAMPVRGFVNFDCPSCRTVIRRRVADAPDESDSRADS